MQTEGKDNVPKVDEHSGDQSGAGDESGEARDSGAGGRPDPEQRLNAIDFRLLEANARSAEARAKSAEANARSAEARAKSAENVNREENQKHKLGQIAVCAALGLILVMFVFFCISKYHLYHSDYCGECKASAMYHVASGITPIVSMTVLVIALLIAAFRRHGGDGKDNISDHSEKLMRSAEIAAGNIDKTIVS